MSNADPSFRQRQPMYMNKKVPLINLLNLSMMISVGGPSPRLFGIEISSPLSIMNMHILDCNLIPNIMLSFTTI